MEGFWGQRIRELAQLGRREKGAVLNYAAVALHSVGAFVCCNGMLCMKCLDELIGRNAGLFEQADERASFQFAMIRHNASHRAAPHDDVAAALTGNHEAQMLQCADNLCTGSDGEFRHAPERGMSSTKSVR